MIFASAWDSVVLPMPGMSSISRWPRASRPHRARRIWLSLPSKILLSSATTLSIFCFMQASVLYPFENVVVGINAPVPKIRPDTPDGFSPVTVQRGGQNTFAFIVGPGQELTLRPADKTVAPEADAIRSEEHTSELQSRPHLVCRLLLEKKKKKTTTQHQKKT